MKNSTQQELLTERAKHESWLLNQPGVNGVGVGMDNGGDICLKVFTTQISSDTRNALYSVIQEKLGDTPFMIEEIGEVRKQVG